ncbi:MAG: AMP-binding protein [Syntrophales bacterium]|nr:AMP-binding protein [Syntrophales bacterium]
MNIVNILEETTHRFPDRIALVHDKARLTYSELKKAVCALSSYLKSLGLKKGDRVAIMLPNCPEFVISYFAVVKFGGIAVTVSIQSTPHELRHLLNDSGSSMLITEEELLKRYLEIQNDTPKCRHLLVTKGMDSPSPFTKAITTTFGEINDSATSSQDDPAVIIYTSGLTEKTLGAVLTHGNLYTQAVLLKTMYKGTEDDCSLAVIPFYHAFGAAANMLAAIYVGAKCVLLEHFSMESIFSSIQKEGVTYTCAVPRLYLGMIFHQGADKFDLDSLRFCITGGASFPPEYISPFRERFGVPLLEGYGLTEASPICTITPLDGLHKPGSIGIPIPGVEIRVVDEDGNAKEPGDEGELVVRGPNVMRGYFNNEELTAKVIRNGWLHTGDLARIDNDGYIFLTGRKKRMIITSGFNVYPREVELVLEMHPAVNAARVVGKPDLMRGEIVKALIVKNSDVQVEVRDILRHCRTYLSPYKVPREVEFVEHL